MTNESRSNSRPIVIRWLFILGITAFFLALLGAVSFPKSSHKAEAKTMATGLRTSIKAYSDEYRSALSGDPAQILAAVRGDNPRKIVFFDVAPSRINAQGELIDPWGTPFRFDLSKPDAPRVWSCGPNRKDESGAEGSDDIVSWH